MVQTGLFLIETFHQSEDGIMQPAFSIITPTCHRPYLLQRALRSVVHQTFKDFECMVVDDAGDPDTAEIVKQFNDDRIILIRHSQNRGAAAAYNTGLKASRGRLISILDDDDEYHPDFLEKMHLFFQTASSHIGFAWTGIRRVKDLPEGEVFLSERVWPAIFPSKDDAYVAATTIGNGFGLTMRRECLDEVGLYNENFRVCEDTEYLFRLARGFDFATIPEILVKIHSHEKGQLTHRNKDELRLELHEKILMENAGFLASNLKLYDVHFRRLVQISYSLRRKKKGRQIMLKLLLNAPVRLSWFLDFVCYEELGVDAATIWTQSRAKSIMSHVKKMICEGKTYGQ